MVSCVFSNFLKRAMELEASENEHSFIFVHEAGVNLAKTRRRGRNLIGKRATVDVPGQRGANITMCAAISSDGLQLQKAGISPHKDGRSMTTAHRTRCPF